MEVIHARCAGLDVSKKDAKVCVRHAGAGRRKTVETVTTWSSMTGQILALREHLIAEEVTCVVMEATGDYWKPFYYLDSTDAVVDFVSPCGGSTDVTWVQSSATPADSYGANICISGVPLDSTAICDRYRNTLYPNKYSVSPYPNRFQAKVACHEFGHSVGLTHGTEGAAHCMSNGVLYTEATSYRRYASHHINDHINQWW